MKRRAKVASTHSAADEKPCDCEDCKEGKECKSCEHDDEDLDAVLSGSLTLEQWLDKEQDLFELENLPEGASYLDRIKKNRQELEQTELAAAVTAIEDALNQIAGETKNQVKEVVARLLKSGTKSIVAPPDVRVRTALESVPSRGGYGPFETGTISVSTYTIRVVGTTTDGSIAIGARSGNHILESLGSQGPAKTASARLMKVVKRINDWLAEDSEREAKKAAQQEKTAQEAQRTWSVVRMHDGYAEGVDLFSSKSEAMREAKDQGDVYVVDGTQMWNEPLGQVEEHDRGARYIYVTLNQIAGGTKTSAASLHKAAEADEALSMAYTKLIDLKLSMDRYEEIPPSLKKLYDANLKAIDALTRATQPVYQVRMMAKRVFNSR